MWEVDLCSCDIRRRSLGCPGPGLALDSALQLRDGDSVARSPGFGRNTDPCPVIRVPSAGLGFCRPGSRSAHPLATHHEARSPITTFPLASGGCDRLRVASKSPVTVAPVAMPVSPPRTDAEIDARTRAVASAVTPPAACLFYRRSRVAPCIRMSERRSACSCNGSSQHEAARKNQLDHDRSFDSVHVCNVGPAREFP
jgi:hypothetical protein